jgi:hypothetical protein
MTAATQRLDGDNRIFRRFDVEEDERDRRRFVVLASAFAVMAIAAGFIAALLVLRDGPIPTAIGTAINRGVGDFDPPEPPEPIPPQPEPEPEPKPETTKPQRPSDRNVRRALHNLQRYFDGCAREHGGLENTLIRVDFSVEPHGRATRSFARNPYGRTPLGRCVAQVIIDHGKFASSRDGLADVRADITLHPNP